MGSKTEPKAKPRDPRLYRSGYPTAAAMGQGWQAFAYSDYQPGTAPTPGYVDNLYRCRDGETECRELLPDFLPGHYVRGLAAQGNTLLLQLDSALYRSLDAGDTWQKGTVPPPNFSVHYLGDRLVGIRWHVYAARKWEFAVSADLGSSWDTVAATGLHGNFIQTTLEGHNLVFAATDSGLYSSGSDLLHWSRPGNGLSEGGITALTWEGNTLVALHSNGKMFSLNLEPLAIAPKAKPPRARLSERAGIPGLLLSPEGHWMEINGRKPQAIRPGL